MVVVAWIHYWIAHTCLKKEKKYLIENKIFVPPTQFIFRVHCSLDEVEIENK